MLPIYCGNNQLEPALQNGIKRLGTRYECLKQGYGRGFYEPVDPKFLSPYQPIDVRKFYCGNENDLPDGYHDFGTLHSCSTTGYGAGKRVKAQKSLKKRSGKRSTKRSSRSSKNRLRRSKRSSKHSKKRSKKLSKKRSKKRGNKI